jgi:hypothetical protein
MIVLEIEKRGILNKEEFKSLKNLLEKYGRFKGYFKRLFIDYTPFLKKEENIDVRIRITNNIPEIIIKKGKWFGTVREEVSVILEQNQLVNAIKLMSILGYKKGILGIRKIWRYDYKNVEFSLTEVIKIKKINNNYKTIGVYAYFFEIEGKSQEDINNIIGELGLKIVDEDTWISYVKKDLNKNANITFEADKDIDKVGELYDSV